MIACIVPGRVVIAERKNHRKLAILSLLCAFMLIGEAFGADTQAVTKVRRTIFLQAGGSIEGSVWQDIDGNGVLNPGEPGLVGWTIFLDFTYAGHADDGETTTTTGAAG